jgi:CHAT domain-containing protein
MSAKIGNRGRSAATIALFAAVAWPQIASAAQAQLPLSTRSSFRLGDAGVLCTAQVKPTDKRLTGIFDRAYLLTCRDAASPVGSVIAVRHAVDLAAEPSAIHAAALTCGGEQTVTVEKIGSVRSLSCRDDAAKLDYRRYAVNRGKTVYLVEGLAGYDPALRLALASVVTDRAQKGEVRVAVTEVSDAAAFARTQAGSLDAAGARSEAYLRNNGGRFAESAEFFENLADRNRQDPGSYAEALANQGLQQSNLGNFPAAALLFEKADAQAPRGDGVTQRLIRNYRAINQLNQRDPAEALVELAKPVSPVSDEGDNEIRGGLISVPMAHEINRESPSTQQVNGIDHSLSPAERAAILDAQGIALSGTAARQQKKLDEAAAQLSDAITRIDAVRNGRVVSASWLKSEISIEQGLVSEARGDRAAATAAFDNAIAIMADSFPQSPALLAAKARKAAFLARSGDQAGALTLFDQVVKDSADVRDSSAALRDLLAPYFALLASSGSADAPAAMFRASQVLQRPGVAQTQAILARQLSEGNDEAAAMFRLAVARTREIARTEGEIARLNAKSEPNAQDTANLAAAQSSLEALRGEQTSIQAKLADYSRYKVLAPQGVELSELQAALRDGEGYYKMMIVGNSVYGLYATHGGARVLRVGQDRKALAENVGAIRDTIARVENGAVVTDPFDVDRARALYVALFAPIDGEVKGLRHLVFEPDGPMLQLPPYLLVASQPGVDAYKKRIAAAGNDEFDFTGVDWLGRGREMSISVGPRSFLDVRAISPSHAPKTYLGLGSNAVPAARPVTAVADDCDWPITTWQKPISPDELNFARAAFGTGNGAVISGAAFTDTALLADPTLDDYRVLHFATHGLVTAPRPECPARPALVTSFDGPGSDGLLSFREVFDLKLDADVVILSACDTAGTATVGASREAGVTTGGNYALDGLVRAFIGAGARSVVASHWPVPDDYDATKRLISGLVNARQGQPLAASLAQAQQGLMDDKRTSHPFYWAAFIILGDGAKPLLPGPDRIAGASTSAVH